MSRIICRVPSLSEPGKSYGLWMEGTRLCCECPRFNGQRRLEATCSHVEIWDTAERAIARCAEAGHGTVGTLCKVCLAGYIAAAARRSRQATREAVAAAKAHARDVAARARDRRRERRDAKKKPRA